MKILAVLLFTALYLFQPKPKGEVEGFSPLRLNPSPLKHFNFNLESITSHILWIRWISRDHNPYEKKGLSPDYYFLDTITELNPDSRHVYRFGAETLSVLIDDEQGAKLFFDKGIKAYPNYWPLQYSASFHYMEELKEPYKAAELLKKAHSNGGPDWFLSLAGKLYTDSGQKELAVSTLKSYLERYPQGKASERVKKRLKKLQTQP